MRLRRKKEGNDSILRLCLSRGHPTELAQDILRMGTSIDDLQILGLVICGTSTDVSGIMARYHQMDLGETSLRHSAGLVV